NLPQLQHDVLGFVALASHLLVLLKIGIRLSQFVDHFSGGTPMAPSKYKKAPPIGRQGYLILRVLKNSFKR
ncbi:hypothetical protein, partial [Thetidibacter halocola]